MSVGFDKTMVVIPPVNSTALAAIRATYDRGDIKAVILLGFPEHNIPDVGLIVSGVREIDINDRNKLHDDFKNAITILGPAVKEMSVSNNKRYQNRVIINTARQHSATYVYVEDPKRYGLTENNFFKLLTLNNVHSELQSANKTNHAASIIGESSGYASIFTKTPREKTASEQKQHNLNIPLTRSINR